METYSIPFAITKRSTLRFNFRAVEYTALESCEIIRRKALSAEKVKNGDLFVQLSAQLQERLELILGKRRFNQLTREVTASQVRLIDVIIYL